MDDHPNASDAPRNPVSSKPATSPATSNDAPAARKPYRKPELVKLGSLQDITRSTGYVGQADGGRFPRGFRTGR